MHKSTYLREQMYKIVFTLSTCLFKSFSTGLCFCFQSFFPSKAYTHTFNGPFSRTTWVGRYQKGKTNLDLTEARDSEWQWHQVGHMQVCTSLQTDNHTSTSPLSFLQAGCPSCRPTNSIKALKALFPSKAHNVSKCCQVVVTTSSRSFLVYKLSFMVFK